MQPIVEDVREKGDAAVMSYTKRFDKVDIANVCVPIEVIPAPQHPSLAHSRRSRTQPDLSSGIQK